MQKEVNAIAVEAKGFDIHVIVDHHPSTEELYLFCVSCQIAILSYLHAAVLASYGGPGLMTVERHGDVVERYSMTARNHIDTLQGKRFYAYIANLTANPEHFPKLMIVHQCPLLF